MGKKKLLIYETFIIFGLVSKCLGLSIQSLNSPNNSNDWDILIFSQTWPQTLNYTLLNKNQTCKFPKQKDLWTVHGLWPTKLGQLGPTFCNNSVSYDPNYIIRIQDKLNEYWINFEILNTTKVNISNNKTSYKNESIWCHQWEKHGTCALTLPALNSVFKYFNQGVEWSEKYNMKDILEKGGIKVNNTALLVTDYWKALKSVLKTNAWIQCVLNNDTKQQMISEIRLCFDKSLKIIDCNGTMFEKGAKTSNNGSLTSCDLEKPIFYLNYVPDQNSSTNSNYTNDDHSKVQIRSKRNKSMLEQTLNYFKNWYDRLVNQNKYTRYSHYWNRLVFSQSWPYTFCHLWTADSKTHMCNLPTNHNQWTIHGIWPTRNIKYSPSFCDRKASFNLDVLEPIIPELQSRWTEIKLSNSTMSHFHTGGLWEYEWKKHGTCAETLPALDTELKYFTQALDWSKKYSLSDSLALAGITPNGTYRLRQFWETLTTEFGKRPRITCHKEMDANDFSTTNYIQEIRLCFNKHLSLVNCDRIKDLWDSPNSNCPSDEPIYYVGAVF